MKKVRPKKYSVLYYVGVFLTVSVTLAIYGIFDHRRQGVGYFEWIVPHVYFPFFITLIMIVFQRFRKKMDVGIEEDKEKHDFVIHMSEHVKEKLEYSLEDFRVLQENPIFQKSLYDAYNIYTYGESEMLNFGSIEERFKKESKELKAIIVIRDEVYRLQQEKQ